MELLNNKRRIIINHAFTCESNIRMDSYCLWVEYSDWFEIIASVLWTASTGENNKFDIEMRYVNYKFKHL